MDGTAQAVLKVWLVLEAVRRNFLFFIIFLFCADK